MRLVAEKDPSDWSTRNCTGTYLHLLPPLQPRAGQPVVPRLTDAVVGDDEVLLGQQVDVGRHEVIRPVLRRDRPHRAQVVTEILTKETRDVDLDR